MSKPTKIISGILTAISIIVIAFFVLSRFWLWVTWEVLASVLVAYGCVGEWYLFLNPATEGNETIHRVEEFRFITCVAVGVTMELVALAHAIPEAVALEKEIALANERTASVEQTNLVLRAKIVELEHRQEPRRITAEQRNRFIFLTEKIEKIPIRIAVTDVQREPVTFACDLRELLGEAGFPTNSDTHFWGINVEPTFTAGSFGETGKFPDVTFFGNFTNTTSAIMGKNGAILGATISGERTNGYFRPIVSKSNEADVYAAIAACFSQIGITSIVATNWGHNEQWPHMIVVEPK